MWPLYTPQKHAVAINPDTQRFYPVSALKEWRFEEGPWKVSSSTKWRFEGRLSQIIISATKFKGSLIHFSFAIPKVIKSLTHFPSVATTTVQVFDHDMLHGSNVRRTMKSNLHISFMRSRYFTCLFQYVYRLWSSLRFLIAIIALSLCLKASSDYCALSYHRKNRPPPEQPTKLHLRLHLVLESHRMSGYNEGQQEQGKHLRLEVVHPPWADLLNILHV